MKRKIRIDRLFPPGYDYQKTCRRLLLYWGLATGYSFLFFMRYHSAYERLYVWVFRDGKNVRVLRDAAKIEPFWELAGSYFVLFFILCIMLVFEAALQYFSYQEGSRSILLIKRLPDKTYLFRTCLLGPLLGMGIVLLTAAVLALIYYAVYIGGTPPQCL